MKKIKIDLEVNKSGDGSFTLSSKHSGKYFTIVIAPVDEEQVKHLKKLVGEYSK